MVRHQSQKTPTPPKVEHEKTTATVMLSEVMDAGMRLEASAFNVAARNAAAAILASGLPVAPLFGIPGSNALCLEAHNAFRFRRIWTAPERGVPFLSSAEIINMRPQTTDHISKKLTPRLDDLMIVKWDVLLSCSGTIGNVSLASETMVGSALSQDAIRLRPKDREPDTSGYIVAFLRSRYGRPQLHQETYGSVIVHIEPLHLARIIIPDLPPIRRIAIGGPVRRAYELRDEANALLDDADQLLAKSLKYPPPLNKPSGVTKSIVRASRLQGRFDGSYHNPTALWATKQLAKLGMDIATLGDARVTKEIRAITKFRKRVYVPRGGIPLLSSKQLFQIDPVDVKRLAKGAHTKDLPEIQLQRNMIAVTCSGTIGRVQIIPAYMEPWTANQHATRLIAADTMNPGFIYTWLSSAYGNCLLTRHSYGSVILEIDRDMLASVPIPLPATSLQNQIGDMVLRANDLRDEAWRIERGAIDQLEALIAGTHAPA